MEVEFRGNEIVFNRPLSYLDKLVLRFVKILEKSGISHVIISGYIAILFGRSRNTEDVDLFIEETGFEKFSALWSELERQGFECINAFSAESAYNDYLKGKLAIRFAEKGEIIPNFEIKFPKTRHNEYSLKNKLVVVLNGEKISTSELEMQIAFKLKLGSQKDFEDARHLYKLFKEQLNTGLLQLHISDLGVEKEAERILWKKY
ncbi:MAG: nucleotidyltransferase [Candidatus Diapherotrites archaeon]|nr:nucleotidyltransferase [Candidatus Diapherotrites archaeon]